MSREAEINFLFSRAFNTPRDPRSDAYKDGVRAALEARVWGERIGGCPYMLGSAEADAWFSGLDEGKSIYREWTEVEDRAATT